MTGNCRSKLHVASPQEVGSFGDHVLEVSEGQLAVSVQVSLLDGFVTHQANLVRCQFPFGQQVEGLPQVLLADKIVPVEIWTRTRPAENNLYKYYIAFI